MEIFVFARFDAKPGAAALVGNALREVVDASRQEDGCLDIHVFRSIRNAGIFYIHSRWKDIAAFELHAGLPHTVRFIQSVQPLLHDAVNAERCEMFA